jgi:arsenate reductase (thioredoxin)
MLRFGGDDRREHEGRVLLNEHPVSMHQQYRAQHSGGSSDEPVRTRAPEGLQCRKFSQGPAAPPCTRSSQEPRHRCIWLRSKSWNEFASPGAPPLDAVITVCDSAAQEVCPIWPGAPVKVHWGIPDPAAVIGSDIDRREAFERAYTTLERRITLLLALPVEYLNCDQTRRYLHEIGETTPWQT